MLTFEAPFYRIKDVMVFRDHAIATQFYYLAGMPKLSVDANNKLQFSMLKYRVALDAGGPEIKNRDALGGAFLMLGVDCGVDADSLKGQLSSVAQVDGDITLTPVLYTNGTCQIVALDYQPTPPPTPGVLLTTPPPVSHFVKAVVGSTTPSLLGDQRAIFSVALDTDAATLIEAAYDNDMSPIGVIYRLEFAGLLPALEVSATVDFKRVYDELKIDFQLGVNTDNTSSSLETTPATNPQNQNPQTQNAGTQVPNSSLPGSPPPAGTATQPDLTQQVHGLIVTAGDLGTAQFVFTVGVTPPAATATPKITIGKATDPSFKWTIPVTAGAMAIEFGKGNYPLGMTFAIDQKRNISIGNAPAGSAQIKPVPAPPPPVAPPAQLNQQGQNSQQGKTGGQQSNQTPPPTQTTSVSDKQVAVDVNIDYAMQKLVQSGAIKITIVQQQQGKSEDDMRKEAMDIVRDVVLQKFFVPQMTAMPQAPAAPPAPPPGGTSSQQNAAIQNVATQKLVNPGSATGSGSKTTIGFQLRDVQQETLGTLTFDYSVQMATTMVHAPNGFFSALISKTNRGAVIREVDLNDPFFKSIQVAASTIADFTTTDLKSVVLDLAYGGTPDQPTTVLSPTFTAADTSVKTFQSFIENGDLTYRYRTSYYFGQNPLVGSQTTEYHTDWRTTLTRTLVVNPPMDVPMLHVYVTVGLVDWDLIAQIETTLTYDDPDNKFHTERTFVIGPTFTPGEWIVRLTNRDITTYSVRHTWILKDNERHIQGPVQQMSAVQIIVGDPFVLRLPVVVQPEVDPANVARVTVAFHYQDAASQLDIRKLVNLTPPYQPTTVSIPLMNAKKGTYSYQTTLYKTDGSAENRPEVSTDSLSVIVADGALPFDVNVMLVGDLAQAGLSALQVDLRAEPLDGKPPTVQSHLFQPGVDPKWTQRLMLRTDRTDHTYQVQTTAFYADKEPVQSDWNNHDTTVLAIQPSRLQP